MSVGHHFGDFVLDPKLFAFKFVDAGVIGKRSLVFLYNFPIESGVLCLEGYNPLACWHT